jgi:hypothetical protein
MKEMNELKGLKGPGSTNNAMGQRKAMEVPNETRPNELRTLEQKHVKTITKLGTVHEKVLNALRMEDEEGDAGMRGRAKMDGC